MKDKLRELAERWKAYDGYVAGKRDALSVCADELLHAVDAEGDGGAVAWLCDARDGSNCDAVVSTHARDTYANAGRTITPLYTYPARSGVVRDEDVIHAWGVFCHSKEIADATTGDKNTLAHMRAALESFARRTP